MRISLILAHPNKKSFNHAIATSVIETLDHNGHDIYFHDLYEEHFDPILPFDEIPKDGQLPPEIEQHCREISAARRDHHHSP
jgi:putative NADPH-quinone reductase